MVLAYNAGTIPQPNIICYQIKSPVPGMGYILLSCQPMGHLPHNITDYFQGYWLLSTVRWLAIAIAENITY